MKNTNTPITVTSVRGIVGTFTLALALGVVLASPIVNAQADPTLPLQAGEKSFVDNFVSNRKPLTYVPVLGTEDITYVQGSLELSSTNLGYWLALAKVAKNGDDIVAESTSMRAVVRCSDASGLALWTRDGFFVCRLLPVAVDGSQWQLQIADWWGLNPVPLASVKIDENLANKDVVVEFDTIGATLTVRAWELENPANFYEISCAVADGFVAPGTVGIGALGYTNPESGAAAPVVSYSQFNLKIIPPTSNRR